MLSNVTQTLKSIISKTGGFFAAVFCKIWGFVKKHKILSVIIAIVLIIAILMLAGGARRRNMMEQINTTETTVGRMTITESISGSSIVEANDEYSVVPLVTGEILSADFEEGDIVAKDQILYKIDSSDVQNSLESADISVERAQTAYNKAYSSHTDQISSASDESARVSLQKAQNSYNDAIDTANDLTVSAGFSGTVSEVYVSSGDDVGNGTKIADITDNSKLKARVPFNTVEATNIYKGEAATVTLVKNGTMLSGVVTSVSSGSETLNGSMRVSYVTIEVENPGAVMEGDSVTAMVGDYACNDIGAFEPVEKRSVLSKVSGTVSGVWVVKGDYINAGSTIATIDSEAVDNQVRNAELTLREAQLSQERSRLEKLDADDYSAKLRAARLSLDEALLQRDRIYEQLDDYTIKAPISGTVVKKNKKAGDKIEAGSAAAASASGSSALAVIYDMSSLCFQLDVDELDIKSIEVGQEVVITADAVEDKTYSGIVENVSINGTIGTNGVTTYPVKVRIQDFDDNLLPGMNIEAVIEVANAEDVLAVPVGAVNRGNTVYVKGEKTDENDRAPEGYRTVQVEIGISNDNFVEIVSGLNEGDIIFYIPETGDNQMMFFPGMGSMRGGGMPGGGMPPGGAPGGGGMPGGGR